MNYRKILLIHESPVIRNLIRRYILSEFNDIQILDCRSGDDACRLIYQSKFDLIFSGFQLSGTTAVDMFKLVRVAPHNKTTPFIVITSTNTDRNIREVLESGITDYLVSPVTAADLRDKINELSDPRKLRTQARFNIPNIRVTVHFESGDIKANVINLTKSSLLCELDYQEDFADLLHSCYLTVKFPVEYSCAVVPDVWCRVLKINVTSWDKEHVAQGVQIVWQFLEIPEESAIIWNQVLTQVKVEFQNMSSVVE